MKILDEETLKELNDLYDLRNKVIHRYIISFIKTRDIIKIAYDYLLINEKVRLILKAYEEMQYGRGFGVYGQGYSQLDEFDETEYKRAYSWANDKHLIDKFKRKL